MHRSKMMEHLFSISREGFWLIDKEGKTIDLNPAMCALLGRPRAEVIGRTIFDFVDEDNRLIFEDELRKRARGENEPYEIALSRPDGSLVHCINNASPIYENGLRIGSVGLWTDISLLKRTEEGLQLAKETAERADRAKTGFLAAASHDLRQPLQAISLNLETLSHLIEDSHGLDRTEAREVLNQVRGSVDNLSGLTNAILDISKLEAGIVTKAEEVFTVDAVLGQLVGDFRGPAREKGLEIRYVPSSIAIASDRSLLTRMVSNLLSNAIRYTHDGRILVGCRRRAGDVLIQVMDTGQGFDQDKADEIFEEFRQLDNPARQAGKGLGLGLAIVRRTADLLGHKVVVGSRPGVGSIFVIEVPHAAPTPPAPCRDTPPTVDETAPPDAVLRQDMPLVMVIEDSPMVLRATAGILRRWGCDVVTAEGTQQALESLTDTPRLPELIVTDFQLPGDCDGFCTIEKLRERIGAKVPAIILTGDTRAQSLRRFADDTLSVLHKPLDPRRLREALEALMAA